MSIWAKNKTVDVATLNDHNENTALHSLGIQFTEIGDDFVKATMPVDERTRQPFGLLHGGVTVALAETVASTAAFLCVEDPAAMVVGLEINANHVRSARDGIVTGTASPLHVGNTTHVWSIRIEDANQQLISICRMTAMVKK